MKSLLTILLVCCFSLGCASTNGGGGDDEAARSALTPMPEGHPLIGSWNLVTMDGAAVAGIGTRPALAIDADGSVRGLAGINRFTSSVKVDGPDGVRFGRAAMTKMAGSPDAMQMEAAFSDRLSQARTYELDGDRLTLVAGPDRTLTFEREK
ncbi:MAG: META domain-containing protein [Planctomycetota bacterium]|jgi:heat shock protein HslJ